MNKRGAEMTIGTIIVIILALVVLVVIIYGFTTGWQSLWQKITGIGGGKVNVQDQVTGCKLACTSNSEYDWCTKVRNVISVDGQPGVEMKCDAIAANKDYGLESCPSITCSVESQSGVKACETTGWKGTWAKISTDCGAGWVEIDTNLISATDKSNNPSKKCCIQPVETCTGTWKPSTENCPTGTVDIAFMIKDSGKANRLTDKCCK